MTSRKEAEAANKATLAAANHRRRTDIATRVMPVAWQELARAQKEGCDFAFGSEVALGTDRDGILRHGELFTDPKYVAILAVEYADALIAELEKPPVDE